MKENKYSNIAAAMINQTFKALMIPDFLTSTWMGKFKRPLYTCTNLFLTF